MTTYPCHVRVQIPPDLERKLRAAQRELRERNYPDEVMLGNDAVIMTLGLGDAMYLTFDGRVIVWNYMDEQRPREATILREVATALVIGSRMLATPELLDLLPARPAGARTCARCAGSRWSDLAVGDAQLGIVCPECEGLGWKLDSG